MRSLKLAGVVACGLALSVTTATAAPQVLDDAALDGVVAGVDFFFPGRTIGSGGGTDWPTRLSVFPILAPVVAPEVIIEVERGEPVVTKADGVTTSTSETTGIPAQEFLANPPPLSIILVPRYPRFTFQ